MEPRPFVPDAPVFLWGPPGVGKSTVGRRAAAALGVPFVDLDDLVEARAGCSVSAVFASRGEAGFRALERAALVEILSAPSRGVVALGGGALVDAELRAAALARGVVVGLRAPLEALAGRIAGSARRPLVGDAGADGAARIERLLADRSAAYAAAHVHLDGARPVGAVASDVARAARDRFAWVPSRSGGYPVRITRDAGTAAADAVFAIQPTMRVLVTDDRVGPLWADAAAATMAAAGRPFDARLAFPHGERNKRLATLERLAEALSDAGADRRALLACVGGGVVSDMGGLLAALHSRGIPWIAVPTTLLSMVDAAVGGKTAVDLARAKNAIGAFHAPRAVLVDVAQSRTEAPRAMRAGLAEAVKTALVGDPELLELLERSAEAARAGDPDALEAIVARSLAVKIGIVARDETEQGERAHLNLGHTLGHALEAAGDFEDLLHGECVAIGTSAALGVGEAAGITEGGLRSRVDDLLGRLGLPTTAAADLLGRARFRVGADKKRDGGDVSLVLVRRPGAPTMRRLPLEQAANALIAAAAKEEVPPVF